MLASRPSCIHRQKPLMVWPAASGVCAWSQSACCCASSGAQEASSSWAVHCQSMTWVPVQAMRPHHPLKDVPSSVTWVWACLVEASAGIANHASDGNVLSSPREPERAGVTQRNGMCLSTSLQRIVPCHYRQISPLRGAGDHWYGSLLPRARSSGQASIVLVHVDIARVLEGVPMVIVKQLRGLGARRACESSSSRT